MPDFKNKLKNLYINKPEFNAQAYKHAIGMIESGGGKNLWNSTSSATGKYQFLYNLIKDDPDMDGVSRREFMNRPKLQDKIMDKALDGKLKGFTYGKNYGKKLKSEYNSDYSVEQLTALTHFLGPGNARKFLKDPQSFKVDGVNHSPQKYLDLYNKFSEEHNLKNNINSLDAASPKEKSRNISEIDEGKKAVDKTFSNQPDMIDRKEIEGFLQNQGLQQSMKNSSNQFYHGGSLSHGDDVSEEVTLFETGGTHKENPLGGIPQGMGSNGKMNLVEEGETKWNDYIFSNAFSLDGKFTGKEGKTSNVFEEGGSIEVIDPKKKKKKSNVGTGVFEGQNVSRMQDSPNFNSLLGYIPDAPVGQKSYPQTLNKEFPYSSYDRVRGYELKDKRNKYLDSEGNVDFSSLVKDEQGQKFLDRYNNDWSRSTLKEQGKVTDVDIDNMIIRGLEPKKQIGGNPVGSKGQFVEHTGTVHLGHGHENDAGLESHERAHASLIDAVQGKNIINVLGSPFHQKDKNMDLASKRYMNQPHEAYGNFVEFRERLGLKPGQKIDKEEFLKLVKEKDASGENFYRTFDDDKIIEALNTIADSGSKPKVFDINNYKLA